MTTSETESPAPAPGEEPENGGQSAPAGNNGESATDAPAPKDPGAAPMGAWDPYDAPPAGVGEPPAPIPTGAWDPYSPPPTGAWDPYNPPTPPMPQPPAPQPNPASTAEHGPTNGAAPQQGVWVRNRVITHLLSTSSRPGVWVFVAGLGWKRLAAPETGRSPLTGLAVLAKANGLPVSFRENAYGQIDQLLV